jgi:hypothetical protein
MTQWGGRWYDAEDFGPAARRFDSDPLHFHFADQLQESRMRKPIAD